MIDSAGTIYVIGGIIGIGGNSTGLNDVWVSADGGAGRRIRRVVGGTRGVIRGGSMGTQGAPKGTRATHRVLGLLTGYSGVVSGHMVLWVDI